MKKDKRYYTQADWMAERMKNRLLLGLILAIIIGALHLLGIIK